MKILDTDIDKDLLQVKHCFILTCCALIPGVGYFIFIAQPETVFYPEYYWYSYMVGVFHIVIGTLATIFCLYEFLIYPYLKNKHQQI